MDVGTVVTTSIQSFFVVLGTALGYALAGINDSKKDKRALDRDVRARHAAYSEDLEKGSHEFQLTLLLELQDSVRDLARITNQILIQEMSSLKESGVYEPFSQELQFQLDDTHVNYFQLYNRLTDDSLRSDLHEFNFLTTTVWTRHILNDFSDSEAEFDSVKLVWLDFTKKISLLNDRLGESLRSELGYRPSLSPS